MININKPYIFICLEEENRYQILSPYCEDKKNMEHALGFSSVKEAHKIDKEVYPCNTWAHDKSSKLGIKGDKILIIKLSKEQLIDIMLDNLRHHTIEEKIYKKEYPWNKLEISWEREL